MTKRFPRKQGERTLPGGNFNVRYDNYYQHAKEKNVYGQSVTKLQNNWSSVNCSGLQEISDTITAPPWFSRQGKAAKST